MLGRPVPASEWRDNARSSAPRSASGSRLRPITVALSGAAGPSDAPAPAPARPRLLPLPAPRLQTRAQLLGLLEDGG